jgi:Na+-driven multidrug efflux pump
MIVTLSVLNIVFSSILVLSYNLNVFGVALGTLLASYITLIIFTLFTYNLLLKNLKLIPRFEKLLLNQNFKII